MRTTLDIENDVLQAAKELAHHQGRTAGEVISELARRGLNVGIQKRRLASRSGIPLLPTGGGVVTMEHIQKIRDEEGI
jgi:hypothetical protein